MRSFVSEDVNVSNNEALDLGNGSESGRLSFLLIVLPLHMYFAITIVGTACRNI